MKISEIDLAVLKSLTTDKSKALEFANENDSNLFSSDVWVFTNALLSYVKTYKELPTLKTLIEATKKTDKQKEIINSIWQEIEAFTHDTKEYPLDLEKIKKRFAEKQVLNFKNKLDSFDLSNLDVAKITNELQKGINNIKSVSAKKTFESNTVKGAISTFKEEYNARKKNPNIDTGIKTGYSFLDYSTDGLRPGELVLIGAESGGGKSLFLMNLAIQMWLQKNEAVKKEKYDTHYNVLYFSLEMPFKACFNRFLACLSDIPSKSIKKSMLNSEQLGVLKNKLDFIDSYPGEFEIVDIARNTTIEKIEAIYNETKLKFEPHIIVIDYLGLMHLENADNMEDHLKLGKISEAIHEFARVNKCIVLSAVQLNRMKPSKDNAEERVGLHRIGRSSMIMHNANIGIQIESRPNEHTYPDMLYHIIKCRDGILGRGILNKNLPTGRLMDSPEDVLSDGEFSEYEYDISDKIKGLLL